VQALRRWDTVYWCVAVAVSSALLCGALMLYHAWPPLRWRRIDVASIVFVSVLFFTTLKLLIDDVYDREINGGVKR